MYYIYNTFADFLLFLLLFIFIFFGLVICAGTRWKHFVPAQFCAVCCAFSLGDIVESQSFVYHSIGILNPQYSEVNIK